MEESFCKREIDTCVTSSKIIIDQWTETIKDGLSNLNGRELMGIGIAMPDPFDYANRISLFDGVNKYESLYGINTEAALRTA